MAEMAGYEILAKCLKAQGVKDLFFIMGGPMLRCRIVLHRGGHPPDRHPPRAGRGVYGAGLFAGDARARRVHGGERPRHPQFGHRARQRADRLLPGDRLRRLQPDQPVRPSGLSGDRPGRGIESLRQIRRPGAQSEAHPAAGQLRLPEGAERQARPGLSRFPRRCALPQGRRGRCRLELLRPADHRGAALCRAEGDQRARRRDQQGQAADHLLGRRGVVVEGLERDAGLCRKGRDPVLHDPARPRRGAGRPPLFLSDDAQQRVSRRRSDHHPRHADELRDRPRRAAALQQGREDRPDRDRPRGTRHVGAQCRHPGRRRLQIGACSS